MDLNLKYIEVKNVQIYSGREVDFHLSYQNFGQDINQFPVVVVNHSLTGNSNVSGQNGWWKDLIGKNKLIDTDRFSVLAFNIPGNCFGKEKNEFLASKESLASENNAGIWRDGFVPPDFWRTSIKNNSKNCNICSIRRQSFLRNNSEN